MMEVIVQYIMKALVGGMLDWRVFKKNQYDVDTCIHKNTQILQSILVWRNNFILLL